MLRVLHYLKASVSPARQGLRATFGRIGELMTNAEIVALFDSTNITLTRLAQLSGRTVAQLKTLLMGA